MSTNKRSPATTIEIPNEPIHSLTYIGGGNTCLVYKADDGSVIKEFAPLVKEHFYMHRDSTNGGKFVEIAGIDSAKLDIIEKRREMFESEIVMIEELFEHYRDENDNMFLVPEAISNSSLGKCHRCRYLGGEILSGYFQKKKLEAQNQQLTSPQNAYFVSVLSKIIDLFEEIAFYHKHNILNLDVKAENLYVITMSKKQIGVRNLDFGSARRIYDTEDEHGNKKDGLISQILSYEEKQSNSSFLIDKIISHFIPSSKGLYHQDRLAETVQNCLNKKLRIESKISDFKQLDILAGLKVFMSAFSDDEDLYNDEIDEWDVVKRIFNRVFQNVHLGYKNSLWESYKIYTELYRIMASSFNGRRGQRLSAEQIVVSLSNVLSIASGYVLSENDSEQWKEFCINDIYSTKDKILYDHGLHSINDIVEFCKTNALDSGNLGKIYMFLLAEQKQLDFRLFPDILLDGNPYSNYDEASKKILANADIPFLRAFSAANDYQKLLLVGEGSIGKSTSLRLFEAQMLSQNQPCLFYECKDINSNDIKKIKSQEQRYLDTILIFDAYDELRESVREEFNDMLDILNNSKIRVIVSSRFDPRTGYVSEATSEIFNSYQPMYICYFTDEQLDSLVSKSIPRNSGYYTLLKLTFFLARHLELEKNNMLDALSDTVKTEAEFIQQYFELLYFDKMADEVQLSDLIHLGKYVHKQRNGQTNRYLERIPNPLKHIFEYRNNRNTESDRPESVIELFSNQAKYLNYLHALYVKEYLLSLCDDFDSNVLPFTAQKLLNMPSTLDISESIYYAGQLLADQSEKEAILAALNSSEVKKQTRYENVLCLFLGCNHDIAEDIPGVFDFYHPVMRENYHDYLHACDRIRELRANSIKEVHFGYSGFSQLEIIDINNDVYFSQGNCLIKKSDNGLYIGCHNSEIPDGVMYIHSHAFSYCDIKSVILPSSVRELDRFAFKYCEMLEYVELGEGVNKLTREAFYKCSAIKTVCIKNKNMQIGHEAYDIRAFVRVPNLEKAIVPTTGVSYIYKIAPHSLRYLDISQGKTYSSLVPLTFDDVEQTNIFEELIIRKDVEYIAEDAFIKFKNNLETIYVEPGGISYCSTDNCLISKQENAIVLGCKNSIIPESGIKRIKSYAFARCDIQSVNITKDIESIGTKAFYKCYELTTIHISTGLNTVEVDVFAYCFKLENVYIESVNQWAQIFFSTVLSNPLFFAKTLQCEELSSKVLSLADGIPLITSGAFKDCRGIEKVFIPSSVKEIRGCAFLYCNDIKEVHIKDMNAWVSTQFKSFSANPLYQGARLYINDQEAKSIEFVENTSIQKHALVRTQSIEVIVLNDGCEVGEEAFKECPNLTKVVIKSPNVKINPSAFCGCTVDISFCGSESEWQTISNGELEGIASVFFAN